MKNKVNNSTMSHNACYDLFTGRWLVSPRDVVILDLSTYDGSCYPAYVTSIDTLGISVIRIKDGKTFTFFYRTVNSFIRVNSYCKLFYVRYDDFVFSVGESIIDSAFDGSSEWTISKFDFVRSRAFVDRVISGRTIGHWCDVSNLVKIYRKDENEK